MNTTTKQPTPIAVTRACRCSDCRTKIERHEYAFRVAGRTLCRGCADDYEWSENQLRWVLREPVNRHHDGR